MLEDAPKIFVPRKDEPNYIQRKDPELDFVPV